MSRARVRAEEAATKKPVAGTGFVALTELDFGPGDNPGIFGSRAVLRDEWRRKLGLPLVAAESPNE